ncbi:PREDICTED: uncharacterized protein LOC102019702 [Chinchilla lanigera]|uniref:uncharacterized protein LOC102019702 n=1 Tax=Chinchilla lanigera TaxID=34839 RepID=UPI00038ECB7D|nr:PREDICTED: uncharacterized protein LOC102019702 [Chinchilla lanigera]
MGFHGNCFYLAVTAKYLQTLQLPVQIFQPSGIDSAFHRRPTGFLIWTRSGHCSELQTFDWTPASIMQTDLLHTSSSNSVGSHLMGMDELSEAPQLLHGQERGQRCRSCAPDRAKQDSGLRKSGLRSARSLCVSVPPSVSVSALLSLLLLFHATSVPAAKSIGPQDSGNVPQRARMRLARQTALGGQILKDAQLLRIETSTLRDQQRARGQKPGGFEASKSPGHTEAAPSPPGVGASWGPARGTQLRALPPAALPRAGEGAGELHPGLAGPSVGPVPSSSGAAPPARDRMAPRGRRTHLGRPSRAALSCGGRRARGPRPPRRADLSLPQTCRRSDILGASGGRRSPLRSGAHSADSSPRIPVLRLFCSRAAPQARAPRVSAPRVLASQASEDLRSAASCSLRTPAAGPRAGCCFPGTNRAVVQTDYPRRLEGLSAAQRPLGVSPRLCKLSWPCPLPRPRGARAPPSLLRLAPVPLSPSAWRWQVTSLLDT